MNSANELIISLPKKRAVALPARQVVFLFILLGLCSTLIFTTIEQASFNTVILLIFVSFAGLILCKRTQIGLNDPSLGILGYFWLIKLSMTIFLLYVGWMPQLDPSTIGDWDYDPQRYYIQAQELIDNNWSPDFMALNYFGILYYYGVIYYVFGHNPVIPALINTFVTLIASLYLVKVGYEIKGQRSSRDWTLAFALLLPEMLWYDVMTSRETLLAVLLLLTLLTAGRYLAQTARVSLSKVLTVVSVSVLVIAAVRTSMLLPVFVSIALMVVLCEPQHGLRLAQKTLLVVVATAALIAGPFITEYIGGSPFDISLSLQTAISAKENIASIFYEESNHSIGRLLIPDGLLQSIMFLPPRMLLYLLAPLPNVFVPVDELIGGNWGAWQHLFTVLSSVINLLAIPYALASLRRSIKTRKKNAAPLVLHISYWVTFMAIAGGNLIIHERYRIMATLLLWGCSWLGARTCSKRLIIETSKLWYGLLSGGVLFYLMYKFVLS